MQTRCIQCTLAHGHVSSRISSSFRQNSKLLQVSKCLLHIGIMNQEMTNEKQPISFSVTVVNLLLLCLDTIRYKQSRLGWILFPGQSFARQSYGFMIIKTVMSLTFRNEGSRNSLWLCRYFGLSWTVNAIPSGPEFTADYK